MRLGEDIEVVMGARELDCSIEFPGRIVETCHRREQNSAQHHEPDVGADTDEIDAGRQVSRRVPEGGQFIRRTGRLGRAYRAGCGSVNVVFPRVREVS